MRRAVEAGVGSALALVATVALTMPAEASHLRPRSVASFQNYALVPAYAPCVAPDRTHGPPLAFPSCSAPQLASSRLTAGNPPAQPVHLVGSWKIYVKPGVPGPPEDASAPLETSIVDVRCGSPSPGCPTAGADYTGELDVRVPVRISDHWNHTMPGGGADVATVQDTELSLPVPCAATADSNIGATCGGNSDVAYHYPGLPKDIRRMVIEFGAVKVFDGGDDGDASTDDGAQPFLTQGVFVP